MNADQNPTRLPPSTALRRLDAVTNLLVMRTVRYGADEDDPDDEAQKTFAALATTLERDPEHPIYVFDQGHSPLGLADEIMRVVLDIRNQENDRATYVRRRLQRHEHCERLIADLTAERDDLLAGIDGAARLCFWDGWDTRYGDRVMDVERLREELLPHRSATNEGRSKPDPQQPCERCDAESPWFIHEDDCWAAAADQRLAHKIASHEHCDDLGCELLNEIRNLQAQIEPALLHLRTHAWYPDYEGEVVHLEGFLDTLLPVKHSWNCQAAPRSSDQCDCYILQEGMYAFCRASRDDFHSDPCKACRHS